MEEFDIVITTLNGLEGILKNELVNLGVKEVTENKRAVSFSGNMQDVYQCNLCLRTAIRVLVPIGEFKATNENELYEGIYEIEWDNFIDNNQTFAIDSGVQSPFFKHSKYAGLKSKDAIADFFRSKYGRRPNVDPKNPDILININIAYDTVRVSLDSSGQTLDKRNYRIRALDAPISEALAAGILLKANYNGEMALYDPMSGSGTFAIEAAMIATNTPPGLNRAFSFFNWEWADQAEFEQIKKEKQSQIKPPKNKIYASDNDRQALDIIESNAMRAKMLDYINISKQDFFSLKPSENSGIVVLNPPYDMRISIENIDRYYEEIGDALKNNFQGFTAWIISANMAAMKKIGLRPKSKTQLFNGPLESKLNEYELFKGSKY